MATTVIGLGYVGLTLSLKLAEAGETVYGVDSNQKVVRSLQEGTVHIREPGIEKLLKKHLGSRFFPSQTPPEPGSASTHILCVNTPVSTDGTPDFSHLSQAARSLSASLSKGDLVVVRSTVPPGATRRIVLPELERGSGLRCGEEFYLCVAPERTVEGNALAELGRVPQIIGGFDEKSSELCRSFFSRIVQDIKTVSSMEAAEMTKLMDNCYRYVTFALGNELGVACEALGLDATEVISAANWKYPRNDIKMPGAGVGGGCLPKDSSMLAAAMRNAGLEPRVLAAAREVNEYMPIHIMERIKDFHKEHSIPPERSKILILGFAFKGRPEVNDTRHSPGGILSKRLVDEGFNVWGYDPAVTEEQISAFGAKPCKDLEDGFRAATCVVVMNNNQRWSNLDLEPLLSLQSNSSLVIDGWGVLRMPNSKPRGITYKRLCDGREAGTQ